MEGGVVIGSIWLTELPDWLESAGLRVDVYDNMWSTRSRSSGGYEKVLGIGIHHDASNINSSERSAADYGWKNASDKPIGAIRLWRDGHILVGAAGATNTMGKGGPLTSTKGKIPQDQGNLYMLAIEAGNNGVGEPWGTPMLDAYIGMVTTLCDRLGLSYNDVWGHAGYVQPSCPGRKIDPAGPTPGYPSLGGTSGAKTWKDSDFRALLGTSTQPPHPPEPEPEPEPHPPEIGDDDMLFICKVGGDTFVGDGVRSTKVLDVALDTIRVNVEGNGTARWRHPARTNLPILTKMADIPTINDHQRKALVGLLPDETG